MTSKMRLVRPYVCWYQRTSDLTARFAASLIELPEAQSPCKCCYVNLRLHSAAMVILLLEVLHTARIVSESLQQWDRSGDCIAANCLCPLHTF
jgi:hypothetical protein